jgi:hypothetical protein
MIGYVGMSSILLAFFLLTRNWIKSTSLTYLWLSSIGGLLLAIYAFIIGSYPFAILNVVYASNGFWSLLTRK